MEWIPCERICMVLSVYLGILFISIYPLAHNLFFFPAPLLMCCCRTLDAIENLINRLFYLLNEINKTFAAGVVGVRVSVTKHEQRRDEMWHFGYAWIISTSNALEQYLPNENIRTLTSGMSIRFIVLSNMQLMLKYVRGRRKNIAFHNHFPIILTNECEYIDIHSQSSNTQNQYSQILHLE